MSLQFCTRCVVSNRRPIACREYTRLPSITPATIAFDAEGVCAACRVAEQKAATDWSERERELKDLLAEYRREDGYPDVIVPGSGGKDSVYVAHVLKHDYGMHPLTVTWRPHLYTAIGRKNFDTWLEGGFDNILVTPNPRIHGRLTRLAFTRLLHPFQPFVLGQRSVAPKLAAMYNVPLVVYGESDAEYEGGNGW